MSTRQRTVMTFSVPPEMFREFKMLAKERGECLSALFREMFESYRKALLMETLDHLQQYGSSQAKKKGLSEEDVERLVFGDR